MSTAVKQSLLQSEAAVCCWGLTLVDATVNGFSTAPHGDHEHHDSEHPQGRRTIRSKRVLSLQTLPGMT
eukprot:8621472-Alexandrium_andersonii.AAC.1